MAEWTGNGTAVAFTTEAQFNTTILVTGVTLGEQTRQTLQFSPLTSARDLHHIGDTSSAPVVTINGLFDFDPAKINNFPDLETGIVDTIVISWQSGATYSDRGYYTSLGPVDAVNNQLITRTIVFQTDNQGSSRGWGTGP